MTRIVRSGPQGWGRREVLRLGAGGVLGAAATSALGRRAWAAMPEGLMAAAKAEGTLNVIACPPDWANWGGIFPAFEAASGLRVDSANPNGTSAEELQAIRSLKGQARAPDVVDVGPSFGVIGAQQKLLAPYKVSTWDDIPAGMKDPDGHWFGDYFGIISMGVNRSVVKSVPQGWADLRRPEYKGMIALAGSPLAAAAAFGAVWAASLGSGGSLDDIGPGVDYFADLAARGNLSPAAATPASLISGQTPIFITWDYLNLAFARQAEGKAPIEVVVPADARSFGNFYVQGISASAPHPKAAQLWEEYLYSDAGQILFLGGYAHPARFASLVAAGKIPDALLKQLPPAEHYKDLGFPTQAQSTAAQKVIGEAWPRKVKL